MIMRETNGRGVDIVLNSLSEEKLQASMRCLAADGKFIEIGKFDLGTNNLLNLGLLGEGRSFHAVTVDRLILLDPASKIHLTNYLVNGLKNGYVKPLIRTIFNVEEVENAFRYMAAGKHIGKVIIKMRQDVPDKIYVPPPMLFNGIARFCGNPDKSYIISGGLGGFGLELADWLITRGVRKVLLISRSGLKTGYQASRIRVWESYGMDVNISSADITTREGCIKAVNQAIRMGSVEGIFHLAMVIKDALFENQTGKNFKISLNPKALAAQYLDEVSRQMCPELRYFVAASSMVCGRGNAGQTNYGMANSVMERICEQRKEDGYPALAVQWGVIGDIGVVAEKKQTETEIEIAGIVEQKITSCLELLDGFLKQDEAVVSSIILAEKKKGINDGNNIVGAVKNILGLRDLKTISYYTTFSELGMDSIVAVEVKQTLEREYELFLSSKAIRSLSFARLEEIAIKKTSKKESNQKESQDFIDTYIMLQSIGDEKSCTVPLIKLQSLIKDASVAPRIFLLPGIEGIASVLEPLAKNLSSHAFCLQYTNNPESSIEELALLALSYIEDLSKTTSFTLVGYSFGCIVALQLASFLEAAGRRGHVILIDGFPAMVKHSLSQILQDSEFESILQTRILCSLMTLLIPLDVVIKYRADILKCKSYDEKMELALSHIPKDKSPSKEYFNMVCKGIYLRIKSAIAYQSKMPKLKSMVKLFKASQTTVKNFDEDYRIQELCENQIEIRTFVGNHLSILNNPQLGYAINAIINTKNAYYV